jgi:dTDP-4-dehydrorhamnose reductase
MDVRPFLQTNVIGLQVLLDACRKHKVRRFLQVSTDEVYGSLGPTGEFTESSPIQPNNPYAATKASADFLVREGRMSAGEMFAVTHDSSEIALYGIENEELYRNNLASFRKVAAERASETADVVKFQVVASVMPTKLLPFVSLNAPAAMLT